MMAPISASPTQRPPAWQRSGTLWTVNRAVSFDDIATVHRALAHGLPGNYRSRNGYLLFDAAGLGDLDIVRLLLAHGASARACCETGVTALYGAAGASEVEREEMHPAFSTPPTFAQKQRRLARYTAIVETLLAHGADPNIADSGGITPLDEAAYRGRTPIVAALLRAHAQPNRRDMYGKTPLEWAAYNGYPQIARMLRAHGARINPRRGLPGPGQRALDEQLITTLMGQDFNPRPDVAAVKALLARGADPSAEAPQGRPTSGPSDFGYLCTPLIACEHSSVLFRLLLAHGADPNGRTGDGWIAVPPDYASARMLVAHGANVNARGWIGRTRLMMADSFATAALLIRCGAAVNARDGGGDTALMLTGSEAVQKMLLAHGARVNVQDKRGETAVFRQRAEGRLRPLLAHGADINHQNQDGQTALMVAAYTGWGEGGGGAACDPDWARVLLRHGADPNLRDHNGDTALMLLARHRNYDVGDPVRLVRLLWAHGARLGLRNRAGHTALQIARRNGSVRLMRLIRQAERKNAAFML